ncbi:hypothetical protein BHM03_00036924 [Ensete ventricosum]|nr:hypothetical protein BHM03_00036924 [Ensete ventricosum]
MERNLSAKVRTDFNELRSSSKMSTRDAGAVRWMSCFAPSAASKFLAAMMTCAPRSAKTLAVSVPIPLAPPGLEGNQSSKRSSAEDGRTGDDDGEVRGVNACGDLLGRGSGSEPAWTRQPRHQPEESHSSCSAEGGPQRRRKKEMRQRERGRKRCVSYAIGWQLGRGCGPRNVIVTGLRVARLGGGDGVIGPGVVSGSLSIDQCGVGPASADSVIAHAISECSNNLGEPSTRDADQESNGFRIPMLEHASRSISLNGRPTMVLRRGEDRASSLLLTSSVSGGVLVCWSKLGGEGTHGLQVLSACAFVHRNWIWPRLFVSMLEASSVIDMATGDLRSQRRNKSS